jgi:hypothetical protein
MDKEMTDTELLDELADAVRYYYDALRTRNIPVELRDRLVGDWHEMTVSAMASQMMLDSAVEIDLVYEDSKPTLEYNDCEVCKGSGQCSLGCQSSDEVKCKCPGFCMACLGTGKCKV